MKKEENCFNHSVKVPRLYKLAASILQRFKNGEGSIKTLIYTHSSRHVNFKALLALLMESVHHETLIDCAIEKCGLLEFEPRFNLNLAKILITEFFITSSSLRDKKKNDLNVNGMCKPIQILMKYEKQLREVLNEQVLRQCKESRVICPRYVRINTLKVTLEDVHAQLAEEGFTFISPSDSKSSSYEEFLMKVKSLNEFEYLEDIHVKDGTLLVFHPSKSADFLSHPLYTDGCILFQDKASCLAVEAFQPSNNSTDDSGKGCIVAIDACAAPGMKTLHLAAKLPQLLYSGHDVDDSKSGAFSKDVIMAVEKSNERFLTLNQILNSGGLFENAYLTQNCDFHSIKHDVQSVRYILVDPSCSGSGIVKREEDLTSSMNGGASYDDIVRLQSLASLQVSLLRHACNTDIFENVTQIVYSTCSLNEEENEQVIQTLFEDEEIKAKFKLSHILPDWPRRGLSDKYGKKFEKCVRTDPKLDLCNGFFVALIKRRKKKKKEEEMMKNCE